VLLNTPEDDFPTVKLTVRMYTYVRGQQSAPWAGCGHAFGAAAGAS
jgi:hypothetical protein